MSAEARRNLAVPLEVQVRLPDGAELRQWAVNLSAGGLCLHASERLTSKEGLLLSFELPELPSASIREDTTVSMESVAAHVVWEGDVGPNRFIEIGLSFEGLSKEQTERLTEWASQPTNRRR